MVDKNIPVRRHFFEAHFEKDLSEFVPYFVYCV